MDVFFNDPGLIGNCYNNCPIECTEVRYGMTISSSSYPTEWYADVLTSNAKFNSIINSGFDLLNLSFINYTNNFVELKNAVARLNVFYEDLRYTVIDDSQAMDVVTLLGILGGNLGLFLGIEFK
jgi:hypothetical protein